MYCVWEDGVNKPTTMGGDAHVENERDGHVKIPRRLDLRLIPGSIANVSAPVYVFGLFDPVNPTGAAKSIDRLLGGALSALVQDRMIGCRPGEISLLPMPRRTLQADLICFVGLGELWSFNRGVLETAIENLARVFITSQIHSFATVPIGSNTGMTVGDSLNALMNGLLRSLERRDPDHDFRTVYLCENDSTRYSALVAAANSYEPAMSTESVQFVCREMNIGPVKEESKSEATEEPFDLTYLTINQPHRKSSIYQFALLTSGQGAAISRHEMKVNHFGESSAAKELTRSTGFDLKLGRGLAERYLPADTRTAVLSSLGQDAGGYLVVVHDRDSAYIPWEAIVLDNDYCPAIKAGISRHLTTTSRVATRSNLPKMTRLKMLLIRNPTKDLQGAETECDFIEELFNRRDFTPTVLAHEKATASAILSELEKNEYDILHYAGHAIFDRQDHGLSGLICHNKERLTAAMLSKIEALPQLVVLNGCQSARLRGEEVEDEATEASRSYFSRIHDNLDEQATLAETLMLRGVMNLIGTYWPVGDSAALKFSQIFYPNLLKGDRLGMALRKARQSVLDMKSGDWANYIHYGDPHYLLRRS